MNPLQISISSFLNKNYQGSYRFVREKLFIKNFGDNAYEEIMQSTKFIDETEYPFSVRVRSYIEGVSSLPTCVVCGKNTIFNSNNGWQATCSRSCHMKSPDRMEKLKATNLEKYGTTNFLASEEGKQLIKKTNLEKFGVSNYAKSEEYKDRIKSGNITFNRNPELVGKTHRRVYYDSLVSGDIIMPLFSFEEYEGFANPYKKYNWKCKVCDNEFEAILKYHKYLDCAKCRPTGTKMEVFIKRFLDEKDIPYVYRERTILGGLEIDIYVPSFKIGIEMHGLYWHTEEHKDKALHKTKADLADSAGIKLIQIFEDEYKTKTSIIISRLNNLFNLNKNKIHARKCVIREIEGEIKSTFLENNHIQGNNNTSINLGLFHNNELVSLMTFSKQRIALGIRETKEGVFEMNRFCSISNTTVSGAASKLLSHFIKTYNPIKIVSYADRRWSNGSIYEKLGFDFIKNTDENYWYTRNFLNREHRFKYRKDVLSEKLENFDENLSEFENMCNNGYVRIWDAGSKKYELVVNKP